MIRSLTVWWGSDIVGRLALDRHGAMRFTYDGGWIENRSAPPISFSLPKRPRSFSPRLCVPFFEGLLPEGTQRDGAAAALGVSSSNTFQLLVGLGAEVAGALSLLPEGEGIGVGAPAAPPEPLSDNELVALLDAIRTRPLLAGSGERLRMSLAGAQSKIPVVLVEDRIALPSPGEPTTHILKPPIADLDGATENEAFTMRLAARMGLTVAPVRLRVVGGRPCLLVERYDRRSAADGQVDRLHQEDFCQALGILPERKYASDGGPGFPQCFDLIRRVCTRPAAAVLGLLDAAIIQVLLGNADAHGKNYSFLRPPDGQIGLAPLYDLLSTIVYPRFSPKFAMSIAGRSRLRDIRRGDWDRFARRGGLGPPFVRRRVTELCERVEETSVAVTRELALTGLSRHALANQSEMVRARASRLAATV